MNEEIKRKWVDALRSGPYVQGQEYLEGQNFSAIAQWIKENL